MNYKHLFFDMDLTVAPSRQPILPEMHALLSERREDIIIVSGQLLEKIAWQTNNLSAYYLGKSGNDANDTKNELLWQNDDLAEVHKAEIHAHIKKLTELLDHDLVHEWTPVEDRGAQITFSPVGNTAPVEKKRVYDPDRTKRLKLLETVPLESEEIMVRVSGSTSIDYLHKDRHKGTNVARLIEHMGWNKNECVYYGDGLYPGGNDELVIGIIDTIPVENHLDTYERLRKLL